MGPLGGHFGAVGGHFGDFGAHFGDLEWPGAPLESQRLKFHGFNAAKCAQRVPFGGHFGDVLVTFSELEASKFEV